MKRCCGRERARLERCRLREWTSSRRSAFQIARLDGRPRFRVKLSIRVTERFFSGVPHPHLLGVCHPDIAQRHAAGFWNRGRQRTIGSGWHHRAGAFDEGALLGHLPHRGSRALVVRPRTAPPAAVPTPAQTEVHAKRDSRTCAGPAAVRE